MPAPAILAGVASALGAVGGLFSQQSRGGAGSAVQQTPTPRIDTSTAAIAQAKDRRERAALVRNAREERLVSVLTDPNVMGAATVLVGLMLSARLPFHEDPGTNARLRGLAAASMVLMGLGRAGVGDMTSLVVASGVGLSLVASEGIDNLVPDIPGTDIPLYALTGPGLSMWAGSEIAERIRKLNE